MKKAIICVLTLLASCSEPTQVLGCMYKKGDCVTLKTGDDVVILECFPVMSNDRRNKSPEYTVRVALSKIPALNIGRTTLRIIEQEIKGQKN